MCLDLRFFLALLFSFSRSLSLFLFLFRRCDFSSSDSLAWCSLLWRGFSWGSAPSPLGISGSPPSSSSSPSSSSPSSCLFDKIQKECHNSEQDYTGNYYFFFFFDSLPLENYCLLLVYDNGLIKKKKDTVVINCAEQNIQSINCFLSEPSFLILTRRFPLVGLLTIHLSLHFR